MWAANNFMRRMIDEKMKLRNNSTVQSVPFEEETPMAQAQDTVEVFAVVIRKFSSRGPIANILVDKNRNCYYLARNFKLNEQLYGRSLELEEAVIFNRPKDIIKKKPVIIHQISQTSTKFFNFYSRMIRGIGINSNQVFVDSLKMTLEFDAEILNMLAPEGVPFIAGLEFDLKSIKGSTTAIAKITYFYGITSENILFEDCPWPMKRKNTSDNDPNYAIEPAKGYNSPKIQTYAKCVKSRADCHPEECLRTIVYGQWIRLWENSRIRDVQFDLEKQGHEILDIKENEIYSIEAVQSCLDDKIYEIKTKVVSKAFTQEHYQFFENLYGKLNTD